MRVTSASGVGTQITSLPACPTDGWKTSSPCSGLVWAATAAVRDAARIAARKRARVIGEAPEAGRGGWTDGKGRSLADAANRCAPRLSCVHDRRREATRLRRVHARIPAFPRGAAARECGAADGAGRAGLADVRPHVERVGPR